MHLRLRQICLVVRDLAAVERDFTEVFGLSPCHRDPHIGQFGLHNVLLPVGTSFFEIVSPVVDGTAAGRYLRRRQGDGGYMAIFDGDDLYGWRGHMSALGVREAAFLDFDGFNSVQMHPKDTGGPLLEINHTVGGADLHGAYFPAGDGWQDHVRTERVCGISAVEIQADEPEGLASRWAALLRREGPVQDGESWRVAVDNAIIRFVHARDGRGEGLGGVDLEVADCAAVLDAAASLRLQISDDAIVIGGLRCRLSPAASTAG